jgi:hypothetical protein
MKGNFLIWMLSLVTILVACKTKDEPISRHSGITPVSDTGEGILVADRIIQDIIIRNTDPDNAWTEESLKGMQQESLVDTIFNMVYSQRAIAFDFDTNEKLTVKQVKQIEKKAGFSRERIGKIQFTESWYLNPDKVTMTKKVSSLVLGYETFDSQGEFRGYLPVFRITLN